MENPLIAIILITALVVSPFLFFMASWKCNKLLNLIEIN